MLESMLSIRGMFFSVIIIFFTSNLFNTVQQRIYLRHLRGDAAVIAHFMEFMLLKDIMQMGYDENGNCKGEPAVCLKPERLKWEIPEPALV